MCYHEEGGKSKSSAKRKCFYDGGKKLFFQQNDDLIDVIGQVCQIEMWFLFGNVLYVPYICVKVLHKILLYIIIVYFMFLKLQKIVLKQIKHFTEILMTFPIYFQTKISNFKL